MKQIFALSLLVCGTASAQLSARLPGPREIKIAPTYMYSWYDDAWIGTMSMPIEQTQHSGFLTFEYGITERLALDATAGYTSTHIKGEGTDDGMADTTIGLRYNLTDEGRGAPVTLTLRVGGIIEGTYDEDFPFSAGDGASGWEASLLASKAITENAGLYGDFGYRNRNHDVPDDLFGSAGVYVTNGQWAAAIGYRGSAGQDGPDIMSPGFGRRFGFPQVKEVQHNIEASIGYSDAAGRYWTAFYSHTFDGRNTGEDHGFGISVTIPFGGGAAEPLPTPVMTK